jgi:hypothetical protein
MKKVILIFNILTFLVSSCGKVTRKPTEIENDTLGKHDAFIIKHRNVLNASTFDSSYYSKSYSYYWLAGKDTLDFRLYITEWKKDSTLHLRFFHTKPILFANVLREINACFPLLKEDFNISKLASFHFKEPVFYLDLAKEMSSEYEQEFGRKRVSYDKLISFLPKTTFALQLNHFLNPLDKKVKSFGFEKFHLLDKKNYKEYLPNVDVTEYPEFTLNCHNGMTVNLENK